MRILLPLNNNRSAKSEGNRRKQSANDSSERHHSGDELKYLSEEEEHDNEEQQQGFPFESEVLNTVQGDTAEGEPESSQKPSAEVSPSQKYSFPEVPIAKRKREFPSSSAVASVPVATPEESTPVVLKRPRVSTSLSISTDDSKPPAKPMVAPKRSPPAKPMAATKRSPTDDRERNDLERRHSSSSWEENEPLPFGNQNYYKNHPNINPHLVQPRTSPSSGPHTRAGRLEYDPATESGGTYDSATDDEETFASELKKQGLEIVEQAGDGNCLFRAVSLQVYGDSNMHAQVREQCLDFMAVNEEHFGQFLTGEPYKNYIARKRNIGVHGNNPEIQAISELFNRPVQVFTPSTGGKPLNIFHKEYKTTDAPIRLSYHDNNHYNAVIDPANPTAGLGLGLPGLQPGLADKLQVAAATAESDLQSDLDQAIQASQKEHSQFHEDQLQRVLKESSYTHESMFSNKALALSDVDATNFELEQTILETSLQSYFAYSQEEEGRKQKAAPTGRRRRQQLPQASAQEFMGEGMAENLSEIQAPVVAAAAAAAVSAPSPEHPSSRASSAAAASSSAQDPAPFSSPYDCPPAVQELVMNGFDFNKVVRAYELVGENFDDLLSFLMSNAS